MKLQKFPINLYGSQHLLGTSRKKLVPKVSNCRRNKIDFHTHKINKQNLLPGYEHFERLYQIFMGTCNRSL